MIKKSSPRTCTTSPLPLLVTIYFLSTIAAVSATLSELLLGFQATPDPSTTKFQPLLVDPTGNFSLSFLRPDPDSDHLSLAVVHIPSGEPLWSAFLNPPAHWTKQTKLTFNGSLVISDPHSGACWSTNTDKGSHVILSSSSNLQILKSGYPIWQSFDYPSNTIVQGQNFTSQTTLVSSNSLYTLRLGPDFIGLYAAFKSNKSDQIYYKRTAMQAKSTIVIGQGPIYLRVSPDGYLGMYQKGSDPADVQSFSSYLRSVPGIRIIRIEEDGNLKAYYWSGSEWVLDYEAISETCELPNPCGPYGLCRAGGGCSCLENNITITQPGECYSGRLSGNLCDPSLGHSVLRRVGVELPFKELMGFIETTSYEKCESSCESNCTCWGALYSNASGRCYPLDYPVQTLLSVGDEGKLGYFKVQKGVGSNKMSSRLSAAIGLLCGALVLLVLAVGFGGYRVWKKRMSLGKYLQEEEIVAPGPYKNLGSESFRSIELSNR